ncbi:MAG: aspartate--ammonia ligase [Proteobacteria bacterium]|nr:aspartate--ammonia ligase [Pseudomonadota bacterium]
MARAAQARRHRLIIPEGYRPKLHLRETEVAIKFVKDLFQNRLARVLSLQRVSAPIAVTQKSGVNDYLNGIERPASFYIKDVGLEAEIVQSLAKWKRAALADYGMRPGEGLYTDMNAIRPDERLDSLHSVYVDQWDWEKIVRRDERSLEYLKGVVRSIYAVIAGTERMVCRRWPKLGKPVLPPRIHFVHSEDLEAAYPSLSPEDREERVARQRGAVFVIGIGHPLADGRPHDGRAPDYDDWWTETGRGRRGLNGDIIVWNPTLGCSFELSSMGIRVDKVSLKAQLALRGVETSPYHRRILSGDLPLSIGGGIGQSRLCMFFLRKAHIGEVQAAVWPDQMRRTCADAGIELL